MELLQGDCLELMKEIPDGSVNLILCDLPYGITDCKWDSPLPMEPLWEQYRRVIGPVGVIALFGTEPFSTRLRSMALDLYKYDWVWIKDHSTGFVHAKNRPMRSSENISVFSTGSMGHRSTLGDRRMPYNPQGIVPYGKTFSNGTVHFGRILSKRPSQKDTFVQEATGYPDEILYYAKPKKPIHPTQKPVPLLEYLIKTYTDPGETVLDNCMGSGSTGVACIHTGREFIGMELDGMYYQTAVQRIEEAQAGAPADTWKKAVRAGKRPENQLCMWEEAGES